MPPNVPIVTPDFLFSSSVKRGCKSNEFDLVLSNAEIDSKAEESISTDDPTPPALPQLKNDEVEDALVSALATLLIAPIPLMMPVTEDGQTVTPPTTAAAPATPEASSTIGKTESLMPMPQTLTSSTTDSDQDSPLAEPTTSNFQLQTSDIQHPTSNFQLQTTQLPQPQTVAEGAAQPVGEVTVSEKVTVSNEASPLPKGEEAKIEIGNTANVPSESPKEASVQKEVKAKKEEAPRPPSRITESAPPRVEANQPALQANAHAPDPKGFENSSGLSSSMTQLPEPARHVVMNIHRLVQVGASEVKLPLQPESLGRVNVQLHYDGGQVRVHLSAENSNTGALLQEHSPTLRAALVEAGVSVGQLTVTVGDGGARHGRRFAAQQNELNNRYRQKRDAQIESTLAIVTSVKNGRMDIKL